GREGHAVGEQLLRPLLEFVVVQFVLIEEGEAQALQRTCDVRRQVVDVRGFVSVRLALDGRDVVVEQLGDALQCGKRDRACAAAGPLAAAAALAAQAVAAGPLAAAAAVTIAPAASTGNGQRHCARRDECRLELLGSNHPGTIAKWPRGRNGEGGRSMALAF